MDRLFAAFESAGKQLYLVGGAVRDAALGRSLEELTDLDFATDATADESLAILRRAGLGTHDVGKRFGTVGAVLRGPGRRGPARDVQITTFRPTVEAEAAGAERGDSLVGDLSRRDFTVNAMALGRDGRVVDPWSGRADLAAGRLRAVGEPERMLRDDPLRVLRIARFVAALDFEADEALREAARARAPSLLDVSRERWLQELDKLLTAPSATRGLEELEDSRALTIVLPEVQALVGFHKSCQVHHKDLFAHTLGVVRQTRADRVLRWAALLHDIGKAWTRTVDERGTVRFLGHEAQGAMLFEGIAARFRFDKRRTAQIGLLIAEHGLPEAYTSEWGDGAVRRLARRAGERLELLLELAAADLTTRFDDKREAARARLEELRARIAALAHREALRPSLPTGLGRAIIDELGVAEGPAVGKHIERVRSAILDGELPAAPTIADCVAHLRGRT